MSIIWFLYSNWFFIFLVGLISWPFSSLLFQSFRDKGYAVSKIIGLIIVSYLYFLFAYIKILPLYFTSLLLIIVIWLVVNTIIHKMYHPLKISALRIKHILLEEFIFILLYVFWTVMKSIHPQIYQIERFMDFGFIQTILNSKYLPFEDIWMSGLPVNYYYFGHFIAAVILKFTATPTHFGFYFVGSILFAIVGVNAFNLGYEIFNFINNNVENRKVRFLSIMSGVLSLFFVLFAGDVGTALKSIAGKPYWYPDPTRVIPGTITEMPFYSFIEADLHAHVWGIMNGILILNYLFILWKLKVVNLKHVLPLGFFIGIAAITNSWDAITLGLTTSLLLFVISIRQNKNKCDSIKKILIPTLKDFVLYLMAIVSISISTTIIFFIYFKAPVSGFGLVTHHSPISNWLSFWGQFVAIAFVFFLTTSKILKKEFDRHGFVALLIILSFAMLILIDFVYVKDILKDGEWYRANTVFKVTTQVWLWMGVVSGPILMWVFSIQGKKWFKLFLYLIIISIICLSSFNPIRATKQALIVDGKYYGLNSSLDWWKNNYPTDYNGFLYLMKIRDRLPEGQRIKHILEAEGESYTDTSMYSVFLGWPTVAGWAVHEWTWRGSFTPIGLRGQDVRDIYMGADLDKAKLLIKNIK